MRFTICCHASIIDSQLIDITVNNLRQFLKNLAQLFRLNILHNANCPIANELIAQICLTKFYQIMSPNYVNSSSPKHTQTTWLLTSPFSKCNFKPNSTQQVVAKAKVCFGNDLTLKEFSPNILPTWLFLQENTSQDIGCYDRLLVPRIGANFDGTQTADEVQMFKITTTAI